MGRKKVARSYLAFRHEKIIIFKPMGKCKKKNKVKRSVVILTSSYMMTHAIPGPNHFIRPQSYTAKIPCRNQDKRRKNIIHRSILKGNKAYLK